MQSEIGSLIEFVTHLFIHQTCINIYYVERTVSGAKAKASHFRLLMVW